MQDIIDFIWNNGAFILGALLVFSEYLGGNDKIASSAIYQVVLKALKFLIKK